MSTKEEELSSLMANLQQKVAAMVTAFETVKARQGRGTPEEQVALFAEMTRVVKAGHEEYVEAMTAVLKALPST